MQSMLIIGMGRLGLHLARKLLELGNDVMVVDKSVATIEKFASDFPDCCAADCTNEAALASLGVDNFDYCFVTIGEDFEASLVVTTLLKKLGAKFVITKARQDIQAQILRQIGADEIIYPEKDVAESLAIRYNSKNVFDYVELTSEYSIYEINLPKAWKGENLKTLNVRQKHNINVIAIKNGSNLDPMLSPDYVFQGNEHVIVIGKSQDVFKLSRG